LREDGARLELEAPTALLVTQEHHGARHVRRHEVRRELHARELQAGGHGHGAHQQRLAKTWSPLEEHVAAGH